MNPNGYTTRNSALVSDLKFQRFYLQQHKGMATVYTSVVMLETIRRTLGNFAFFFLFRMITYTVAALHLT